jgi:hypothetical protein
MNILKKKIYLIIISILVVVIIVPIVLIFNNSEYKSAPEESEITNNINEESEIPDNINTEYPDNLLQGRIISLNMDDKSLVLDTEISRIISDEDNAEKIITTKNILEFIIYNPLTDQKETITINDLQVGDDIVVFTKESTYREVLTKSIFTALRITKILKVELE